jgi:hypothetical protein
MTKTGKLLMLSFGVIVGIVATLIYQSVTNMADIAYECTSNPSKYTCRFFNRGSASGAMCVMVTLKRDKPTETYAKSLAYSTIKGNRVCSGPLGRGEDKAVGGEGFYSVEDGRGVSGEDLCRTKTDQALMAGCVVETMIVAMTH